MLDKIAIAAVATGFPSGQYSLQTRLEEIRIAVADGATEIDIVINRTAALQGKWKGILIKFFNLFLKFDILSDSKKVILLNLYCLGTE